MKKIVFAALAAALAASVDGAGRWRGLDESNWYSGPKLTEESLAGKVVLVDEWGVNCPPCKALLPRMQSIWDSFKHKPFVLLGSHRQGRAPDKVKELVQANKLTYPIYDFAGLASDEPDNGGGIPYMYVVNHRGKVVYSGRSDREATEALVNALGEIGAPPSLTSGVVFDKRSPYKTLEKQLILGKPVAGIVKRLKGDVEKAGKKSATAKQKEMAEEAAQILKAIEAAKTEIKGEIEVQRNANPEEAFKLVTAYMKSFPEEGAEYKDQLPEFAAKAKEYKAAQKAKSAKNDKNAGK